MNRREALRTTGWITGTGLLAPGVLAALQSYRHSPAGNSWTPQTLSDEQVVRLSLLSDTIIPATDTPSASEVQVPEFVDLIMADVLTKDQSRSITEGLETLEQVSRDKADNAFSKLNKDDRYRLVDNIDDAAFASHPDHEYEDSFLDSYRYLKALILMAYFTSEEGVKQNLHYIVMPGHYNGCIDLPDDGKIMMGNHM